MAGRIRVPALTPEGSCERLERMMVRCRVSATALNAARDSAGKLVAVVPRDELRTAARAGDCQFSHNCAARAKCPLGRQQWAARGLSAWALRAEKLYDSSAQAISTRWAHGAGREYMANINFDK